MKAKFQILILFALCSLFSVGAVSPAELGYGAPAEFEEQESIWLAWPEQNFSQMADIIAAITPHEYVDLLVNGQNEELARSRLTKAGVDLTFVRFHHIPYTDFWLRDIGSIFIRNGKGERAAVALTFNAWGYGSVSSHFAAYSKENGAVSGEMATAFGIPVFRSTLVAEGGGLEFNGKGTLITSESVILQPQRNPNITKEQAEAELKQLFGLKNIIWVKKGPLSDDAPIFGPLHEGVFTVVATNGHTDEFVRWISDDTVLLAEVTEEEAEAAGPGSIFAITRSRMEENFAILSNATNQDGKPLKIIRIPVAEDIFMELKAGDGSFDDVSTMARVDAGHENEGVLDNIEKATFVAATSYLNYLVTNKTVLVARYWKPGRPEVMKQKDEQAKAILQEAFPGRKIVSIESMEDINIYGGGIHCISQQMPKAG